MRIATPQGGSEYEAKWPSARAGIIPTQSIFLRYIRSRKGDGAADCQEQSDERWEMSTSRDLARSQQLLAVYNSFSLTSYCGSLSLSHRGEERYERERELDTGRRAPAE